MEKLTIKHVKSISVLATRKMFDMLFKDIQQGRDIEKNYGLNPYEINLIFHVTKTPYGVPKLEYETEKEIKSSFEHHNYPDLSYMKNKGNFLAFMSKAVDHLHNQYPDTQPKLWQMAYVICQNMKLKITRYQIETIKAAGFNPATVLIYCGLIQHCNSKRNNSFNLTNHDRTIGVNIEINLNNKNPDEKEIKTWVVYENQPYMMVGENIVYLKTIHIPHVIQTQMPGKKLSQIVESSHLIDAIIAAYKDGSNMLILNKDDPRFACRPACSIISEMIR